MVSYLLDCGKSAIHYVYSSCTYGIDQVHGSLKSGATKVLDVVLPRNPVTRDREFCFLPTCVERAIGAVSYDVVCPKNKISTSLELTQPVAKVFDDLVKQCVRKDELHFEVRVKKDKETVNAFCLPGGKVVVTTAMLEKLEEELKEEIKLDDKEHEQLKKVTYEDKLAAVLGHEISHACAGHGRRALQLKLIVFVAIKVVAVALGYFIERREEIAAGEERKKQIDQAKTNGQWVLQKSLEIVSHLAKSLIILSHSRSNELEADKYGIKIAAQAHYQPEGAIWLQHKFIELKGGQKEERHWFIRMFRMGMDLFSTHPPSKERLEANRLTVQMIKDKGVEAIYPEKS